MYPPRPQAARVDPPALHSRAMDNLAFIRETMEQAAAFTAVSGMGMVFSGVIALGAAWMAGVQHDGARWIGIWLGAAAVALVCSGWATVRKSARARMPLFSGAGRKF